MTVVSILCRGAALCPALGPGPTFICASDPRPALGDRHCSYIPVMTLG